MRIATMIVAAGLCVQPSLAAARPGDYYMYVGTDTGGEGTSKGIYAWRYDSTAATLAPLGLQARSNNPVHLWAAPDGRSLYAVNWRYMEDVAYQDTLSAFEVDAGTGGLRLLDMVDSKGLPAREASLRGGVNQVVLDPSGRIAIACNAVGTVVAFPVAKGGALGQPLFVDRHADDGAVPHEGHRVGTMVHGAAFDPAGKFLYVADLGLDRIYIYRVDAARRSITPFAKPFIAVDKGSGPRRLQVHPNGRFLYVDHEQAAVVKVFRLDRGRPVEIQSISTVPPGATEVGNSEIQIDRTGRYVYVANRGRKGSSVAAYRVDASSGTLASIGFTAVDGVPNNITIDPANRFLFVSSVGSNTVSGFAIDPASGRLSPGGVSVVVNSPGAVRFVPAP